MNKIEELGREEMKNQYGYNAYKTYYDRGFLLGYKKGQAEQLILPIVSNTFKAKIEAEIDMFETKLKKIKDDVEMSFTKPDQWAEEINLINGRLDGLNSALNYC